ncbi:YopX family protein [Bacillus sonorensis]|uniref:YopX family protein n=2 Tax=Bacillus sonorensis TaxID=119858 RepID=UPI00227F23AB|nr:YopX family protein [Bacillus sonorensis]MCY8035610.1 YopX family protein [Bacillus sonorensis]
MTHLHYRVWDGEQMHYWDDEGISLTIKNDGSWFLWHYADGCVVSSDDKDAVLMWGTGVKDDEGKMIYPGDDIEYYIGTFTLVTHEREKIRMTQRIFISGGNHNIPLGYGENLKVIGNLYEVEAAE